jgi:Protein of unknown function (DUF1648)
MSDTTRRVLAWLPMTALLALAFRMVTVWDQLPALMMSHFDAQGNANGYMPRTTFFVISFAVMIPTVMILALIAERVGRRKPSAGLGLLALAWITDGVLIATFWGAITANLDHAPLSVIPIWVFVLLLVPVVLAIGIDWRWWLSKSRREAVRQVGSAQIITEQRHGSQSWAILFSLSACGLAVLMLALPSAGRPGFVLPLIGTIVVLILASALWAWRGFVYRFTTQGIEIRALGIRLRSIPRSQIKDFSSERCNPLTDFGGWGIKGFGSDTAYIWGGRKVLHIVTNRGDVYLGHNDPDRLVRDLEAIMNPAHHA